MRTKQEPAVLREDAVRLRRAGKSRRQIKQILGPVGNRAIHNALRGEPPPEWTRRPGCQRVDVRQSCELYGKIEGWTSATTRVTGLPAWPGAGYRFDPEEIISGEVAPGEGFEPPLSGPKPL